MQINILEEYGHESQFHIFGDIKDVVNGLVQEKNMESLSSNQLKFALGGSSPGALLEAGESLIIHQKLYLSRILQEQGLKCFSHSGEMNTFFLAGVSSDQKPYALIEVVGSQIRLDHLFYELFNHCPEGFCIAGQALFEQLDVLFIRKPPEYGAPFFGNLEKFVGEESRQMALGFVVGFAAPCGHLPYSEEKLSRLFYSNPLDEAADQVQSHSHVALLNERSCENIDLDRDIVGVRHLLNKSTINYGRFEIYKLNG